MPRIFSIDEPLLPALQTALPSAMPALRCFQTDGGQAHADATE
ncbi:MAG TPA: hypothetical protein PLJ35_21635 [Anaerolineae bacterium]|nr:hypothetical protein [Anaerolineae bacterium]HOR01423.1 hypothetical protein [Anaerolineae bacterium]HPL30014.1 hypothetical protein [Anaerolineae bacterium]